MLVFTRQLKLNGKLCYDKGRIYKVDVGVMFYVAVLRLHCYLPVDVIK